MHSSTRSCTQRARFPATVILATVLFSLALVHSPASARSRAGLNSDRYYSYEIEVPDDNYWWLPGLHNVPDDGTIADNGFPPCETARAGAPSPCAPLDAGDANGDPGCWSGDCYYVGNLNVDSLFHAETQGSEHRPGEQDGQEVVGRHPPPEDVT